MRRYRPSFIDVWAALCFVLALWWAWHEISGLVVP